MASANSLIHAFKRAAATSSTSLLSKLVPTAIRHMFNGRSDDSARAQGKDGLYVRMKIPELKKKPHSTFSVEQNTMILKEKSSGREIERRLISASRVDLLPYLHGLMNGATGEMENGMLSLWLPGSLQRLNEEEEKNMQVITRRLDDGFYAQFKMPGMEINDHYKLSVEQNKMIIKEQAVCEGETASAMVDLPPNLHMFNGTKGEMKDGVCSLYMPAEAEEAVLSFS